MAKQEKKQVQEQWDYVKIIGAIQLCLGIILVIASVISIFYIPGAVMDKHERVNQMWAESMGKEEGTTTKQITVQGAVTRAMSGIEHLILFGLLEAILLVLSIMLMMQGIVNVKE